MKLLYIGNKLSKHNRGQTVMESLGPDLEREGFTVRYTSDKKGLLWRFLDIVWSVMRYARSSDYVLIDTYSTWSFYYVVVTATLCRLFQVPYISILHGGHLPNRLQKWPRLSRWVFAHAYANVAPSGYLYAVFKPLFSQTITIPNAIPIKDYTYQPRDTRTLHLLWVRSLVPLYHPEMALQVCAALQHYHPCTFTIIGPDPQQRKPELEALAKQWGISVIFTGKLTKAEWHQRATSSTIFLNTTRADNTPVSVIEAMALGLPVVSTHVGGLPYLITPHETGLLVPSEDVQAMTEAVLHLHQHPDKALKMAEKARAQMENFDWSVVKEAWIKLLKS